MSATYDYYEEIDQISKIRRIVKKAVLKSKIKVPILLELILLKLDENWSVTKRYIVTVLFIDLSVKVY